MGRLSIRDSISKCRKWKCVGKSDLGKVNEGVIMWITISSKYLSHTDESILMPKQWCFKVSENTFTCYVMATCRSF